VRAVIAGTAHTTFDGHPLHRSGLRFADDPA
jgi:hypothetical protein